MGGMWQDDIVYGGEPLEPNIELDVPYILWDCGIVAENVTTSLGNDAVKAEVVISMLLDDEPGEPAKFGTFASSVVHKIKQREDGDLPAVVTFGKVESKQFETDAFVMTFVRKWTGDKPADLPVITALDLVNDIPFD